MSANQGRNDWQELTQRIVDGDADAFQIYYQEFFDLMLREARYLTSYDEQRCLDIVHDAMLKAVRRMKPIRQHAQLVSWTRALVHSIVLDHLRKTVRAKRRDIAYSTNYRRVESDNSDLGDEQVRLIWIESQIATFPPSVRDLFHLRYRLGWTLNAIGVKLGMKSGNVDGRLRRAIKLIRLRAEEQFRENE